MKKIVLGIFLATIAAVGINATFLDKDPLHGKIFEVTQQEYKDTLPKAGAKSIPDEIEFKNGKLYSNLAGSEKFKFDKWMRYDIKKDSTYMEEDEERHYYEVELSSTDDDEQELTMFIKIDDYNIEGTMKLSKKGKLKKHFEFVGKEKPKKKKK